MADPPDRLDLVCAEFAPALDLLRRLGARLDLIYPADDPHTAILSHDGTTVRLTACPDAPAPSAKLPDFRPEFVLNPAGAAAGEGRAGMHYRDLIPSRLGGRYIASHIAIEAGGPVADWVHYHRIAFQLICVRKGWVRVVYEDQGAPFVMTAGDMVLQPPFIRHRVLESSPGLEVVEVTCPALHETFADHALDLPNGDAAEARDYSGQHFLHYVAATAPWRPWHGAEAQETGVRAATFGLAEARILRPGTSPAVAVPPHEGELVFGFLLAGTARLEHGGVHPLGSADAFTIPPDEPWRLADMSGDLRLLLVATGNIRTLP
ncbi:MAG: hypothetical protein JO276_03380 [Sphingomonadaceae bacterium]|nr:hypothetical protein [Sphingomonadaceae bacterium]